MGDVLGAGADWHSGATIAPRQCRPGCTGSARRRRMPGRCPVVGVEKMGQLSAWHGWGKATTNSRSEGALSPPISSMTRLWEFVNAPRGFLLGFSPQITIAVRHKIFRPEGRPRL